MKRTLLAFMLVTCAALAQQITTEQKNGGTVYVLPTPIDMPTPTTATDPVNKTYVDAAAPRHFYANPATYWRWELARASSSQLYAVGTGGTTAPVHVAMFGDSITGFAWLGYAYAFSQYMPFNALGSANIYSINAGLWGSAMTHSESGCVDSRDDNTSAGNWGPGGSRVDCSGTWSLSLGTANSNQFRFDQFTLTYWQNLAGGTFNYNVDGGTNTLVNTVGGDGLGVLTVTIPGASNGPHTINFTNGTGNVRLFTFGTAQHAQPGVILDFVQSGGSQLVQWASFPQYTKQFISAVNPALATIRLGANDTNPGFLSAANYGTTLQSLINAWQIPSTTALVVMTNTPRGTTVGTPQSNFCTDDAAAGALMEGYRAQIFSLAQTMGFSVYDERRAWPGSTTNYTSYTPGCAAGMTADNIHPSATGGSYMTYKLGAAIFQGFETTSRDLELMRNAGTMMLNGSGITAPQLQTSGGIIDSSTGWYFNQFSTQHRTSNVVDFRFGSNELQNANATCYPSSSIPECIFGFRQGSTSARAFSLKVDSSSNTNLDTNNGDWYVSRTGVEKFRVTTNGIQASAIGTGSSSNTDLGGRLALSAGTGSYTFTQTNTVNPICGCWDATTPANSCTTTESTTAVTFTGTGTDSIKFVCIRRN